MDRAVNNHQTGISALKPLSRPLAAVGRAVVDDPEDPACLRVGRLAHHLMDESIEGRDASGRLATAKDLGPVHVESSQIRPGSHPSILVFDFHRTSWLGRKGRVDASAGLDAGLLIGGDHQLVLLEPAPLPDPLIEIEDPPGLGGEIWVAWENPAAVLPRPNGILVQPSPNSAVANRGDQSAATDIVGYLADAPSGQRQAQQVRQLTRCCLDADDQIW